MKFGLTSLPRKWLFSVADSVFTRRSSQRSLSTMSSQIEEKRSTKRPLSGDPSLEYDRDQSTGDANIDILNEKPSTSGKKIRTDVDRADETTIESEKQETVQLEPESVTDLRLRPTKFFYEYNPTNKFELYDNCIERWREQMKRREGIDHLYKYFDADYYVDSQGLRRVYPYYFIYYAFCKRRWIGMTAIDVCKSEFRALREGRLEERFAKGLCRVNGIKVAPDYVLKDSDIITNLIHRHEPPVLGTPVKIIHEDGDLVAVDKPPSIPCHPCGKFRHNSVVEVLAKECDKWPKGGLKLCHRLDRLTSGILVMAKNTTKAKEIHRQIENRTVEKEYICRVVGEFPEGEIVCEQPLEAISFKFGIVWVSPEGKPCKTSFKRLNYNGVTSTVLCRPYTGRMHQIRVHLQYLGHPIINDPIYNSKAFGPKKGKHGDYGGYTKDQITREVSKLFPEPMEPDETDPPEARAEFQYESPPSPLRDLISDEKAIESLGHYTNTKEWAQLSMKYKYDPRKVTYDPDCPDCNTSYSQPHLSDMLMYLHAFRYKGDGWEFKTDFPVWAKEDWQD